MIKKPAINYSPNRIINIQGCRSNVLHKFKYFTSSFIENFLFLTVNRFFKVIPNTTSLIQGRILKTALCMQVSNWQLNISCLFRRTTTGFTIKNLSVFWTRLDTVLQQRQLRQFKIMTVKVPLDYLDTLTQQIDFCCRVNVSTGICWLNSSNRKRIYKVHFWRRADEYEWGKLFEVA